MSASAAENRSAAISRGAFSAWSRISVIAASVIVALFVQVYAGICLRGLYADGAYYAVQLAAHQAMPLHAARITGHEIVQWLVVAAMHSGVETPHSVALVYSVGL